MNFSKSRTAEGVKVHKFHFSLKGEGTVKYHFALFFYPKNDEETGGFSRLMKRKMRLTLTPPAVQPEPEQKPKKEKRKPIDESQMNIEEADALYIKAVAVVRATGNPTATALSTELKIGFNEAAVILSRMNDEGVIEHNAELGEYVVMD